jgi:predicted MPP superfamily phosphohydrolase
MKREYPHSKLKRAVSRRDFLKIAGLFGLDVILGAIVGWNYIDNFEPNWVQVTSIDLKLPRLPEPFSGFRLVQISDIHVGYWMTPERFTSIKNMVKKLSPDLVAITGDIILAYRGMSNKQHLLDEFSTVMKDLTDEYSTIAVLGNHDYRYNYAAIQDSLGRSGVRVLKNSVFSLGHNGNYFHVAGVDDVDYGHDDLSATLAAIPEEGGSMLLVHEPDFADISAATGRFDLQISGHSHGGQVVLPFIGPLILPRLARKYPSGLYKVGDMYQYTNRGVGMVPPNIRLNCRPEITLFTLETV